MGITGVFSAHLWKGILLVFHLGIRTDAAEKSPELSLAQM